MKITCIADLHGLYPRLEGGDLLIVAGDCVSDDKVIHWALFFSWFKQQKYRKKILVAGNHDNFLFQGMPRTKEQAEFCAELRELENDEPIDYDYLCDSGTEFEGLKIWGSPFTLRFPSENPKCLAFTCGDEEELAEHWKCIPEDTDILVTHSPIQGILDLTHQGEHVGSYSLWNKLLNVMPRVHIFGHIHESYGEWQLESGPLLINASHVNERYEPVNKPIRIEL